MAICLARLLRGLSLQHVTTWYDGTWLYYRNRELPLSSSSISRLLSLIGEKRLQDKLITHLIRQLKSKRTILYDITSVSSYSELIRLLEWGYNRDQYDLPQVNLSMILDKAEGIGLLLENYADFVIAVPERYRLIDKLIRKLGRDIEKPRYLMKFHDEIIFVRETDILLGPHVLKGYCYYNPQRAQQEKDSFYKRLFSIKQQIEGLTTHKQVKARVQELMGNLSTYFTIHITPEQITVQIKEKAVARRLNKRGLFLIAYQGQYSWDGCLAAYKEKELIERSFNILKNDLGFSTPHAHKDETLKGLMFVSLLALIIRMNIMNVLKQADKLKDYNFEKMMLQLEKIKAIITEDGKVFYSEITKKQRELLELFNAVPKE
jgi:transposase